MTYFNEASAMCDEHPNYEDGAYMATMKTIEYLGFMLLVPRNTEFMHGDPNGRVYASVKAPVWNSDFGVYHLPEGECYEFICDIGPNAFPYPIVGV